jgi:hypothetical protein
MGIDAKFLRQLDFYIRQLNFYFGQSLARVVKERHFLRMSLGPRWINKLAPTWYIGFPL